MRLFGPDSPMPFRGFTTQRESESSLGHQTMSVVILGRVLGWSWETLSLLLACGFWVPRKAVLEQLGRESSFFEFWVWCGSMGERQQHASFFFHIPPCLLHILIFFSVNIDVAASLSCLSCSYSFNPLHLVADILSPEAHSMTASTM